MFLKVTKYISIHNPLAKEGVKMATNQQADDVRAHHARLVWVFTGIHHDLDCRLLRCDVVENRRTVSLFDLLAFCTCGANNEEQVKKRAAYLKQQQKPTPTTQQPKPPPPPSTGLRKRKLTHFNKVVSITSRLGR
jgi:hypothetical protein